MECVRGVLRAIINRSFLDSTLSFIFSILHAKLKSELAAEGGSRGSKVEGGGTYRSRLVSNCGLTASQRIAANKI